MNSTENLGPLSKHGDRLRQRTIDERCEFLNQLARSVGVGWTESSNTGVVHYVSADGDHVAAKYVTKNGEKEL